MATKAISRRSAHRGVIGALVLVAELFSGACSGTPQVCIDLQQLQGSVQALKDVNVSIGFLARLQSKLAAVEADFATVKQSAAQTVGPQVSALGSSLQSLHQAIQAAVASPNGSTIMTVVDAVRATETAFNALKAVVPDC